MSPPFLQYPKYHAALFFLPRERWLVARQFIYSVGPMVEQVLCTCGGTAVCGAFHMHEMGLGAWLGANRVPGRVMT